jgi:hypothetical protein
MKFLILLCLALCGACTDETPVDFSQRIDFTDVTVMINGELIDSGYVITETFESLDAACRWPGLPLRIVHGSDVFTHRIGLVVCCDLKGLLSEDDEWSISWIPAEGGLFESAQGGCRSATEMRGYST